jgi:hypothetical protein
VFPTDVGYLEYVQCDVVHLLDTDFQVSDLEQHDGEGPHFSQGSFSFFWDMFIGWKDNWQFSTLTGMFSQEQVRQYVLNGISTITYAQAFSMIASKECSVHRDRFLAMCGFLRLWTHAQVSSEIPEDSIGACIWVALTCLEAGDYSPLLLLPFALSYQKSEVPGFSWLVGHKKMIDIQGNQPISLSSPPDGKTIIRGGIVAPSLQFVGYVEQTERIGMHGAESLADFEKVVRLIQDWLGNSPFSLIPSIGRVYDLSPDQRTIHQKTPKEYASDVPDFLPRLSTLLQDTGSNSADDSENHDELVSDLAEFLGVATDPVNGDSINIQLVVVSAGNYVCPVRCNGCNLPFVCQLYFYYGKPFAPYPKIYRIPGPQYATSYPNGVGLIISNNRIVGQMMFGSPSYECKLMEIVEIK